MKHILLACVWAICWLPGSAQDVTLDKKLGAENAAMVEQEIGIYHHDSLTRLINAVGSKLVARLKNNPFEFKFFLADSPEPNAFALPGGYVYITRGILPLIQTEDELAGIMAHEIIHVTQRHSVKQMQKGLVTGILKVPGNLINTVTGTKLGNIINTPIEFSTKAFISQYSRGHEAEADEFGVQLMASAGYKAEALASALERLSAFIELFTKKIEEHSYFSDHPYTPKRVTAIRKAAPFYKPVRPAPITRSQENFLTKFSGLCFGQNPEQGIFRDSLFVQPVLRFTWLTPAGWVTLNKPSVVAGYSEKGDAIVSLGLSGDKRTAHEIGEEARTNALKNNTITLVASGDTTINGLASYQLRLKSVTKKESTPIELIWITYQENIFQLAGTCVPGAQIQVRQSLHTFRKAEQEDLDLVNRYELQYVNARKGETVDQLSARTGNRLNVALTAVINDVTPEAQLVEGSAVKIVAASIYSTKK